MKFLQGSAPAICFGHRDAILWNFDSEISGAAGERAVIEVADSDVDLHNLLIENGAIILNDGDRVPHLHERLR